MNTNNVNRQSLHKKLPDNELVFFISQDWKVHVEVMYAEENIWLSQKKMAELFGTTTQNITQYLKNIYSEKELYESSTCKNFLQVQSEWRKLYEIKNIMWMKNIKKMLNFVLIKRFYKKKMIMYNCDDCNQ